MPITARGRPGLAGPGPGLDDHDDRDSGCKRLQVRNFQYECRRRLALLGSYLDQALKNCVLRVSAEPDSALRPRPPPGPADRVVEMTHWQIPAQSEVSESTYAVAADGSPLPRGSGPARQGLPSGWAVRVNTATASTRTGTRDLKIISASFGWSGEAIEMENLFIILRLVGQYKPGQKGRSRRPGPARPPRSFEKAVR